MQLYSDNLVAVLLCGYKRDKMHDWTSEYSDMQILILPVSWHDRYLSRRKIRHLDAQETRDWLIDHGHPVQIGGKFNFELIYN
jgi:hypothetical protein